MLFINSKNSNKGFKIKFISIALLVINTILILSLKSNLNFRIWEKHLEVINQFDLTNDKLFINDSLILYPNEILSELKGNHNRGYHHSSPDKIFILKIVTLKDSLQLILRRDNTVKNEYWVYDKHYNYLSQEEIGKIEINSLNGF